MNRFSKCVFSFALACLISASSLQAATLVWNGTNPANTSWSTAGNWDLAAFPTSIDTASINSTSIGGIGGTYKAPTIVGGDIDAADKVEVGYSSPAELNMSGGTLTVSTYFRLGNAIGKSYFNFSGGTVTKNGATSTRFGFNDDATITGSQGYLIMSGNAEWDDVGNNSFFIGRGGDGFLEMTDIAKLKHTNNALWLGSGPGESHSVANMRSGSSMELNNLNIGSSNTGTAPVSGELNMFDGSWITTTGTISLGAGSTAKGTLNMAGSSITTGRLLVGSGGGTGEVKITGGGTVTVNGAASTWGALAIGDGGTGTLTLGLADHSDNPTLKMVNDGTWGFGWLRCGNGVGASGTVIVNSGTLDLSGDTAADDRGNFDIGANGSTGVFTQTGGTVITNSKGTNLGEHVGSNATLNLNGGVFKTTQIRPSPWEDVAGVTSTVNFNGGTLTALAENAAFLKAGNGTFIANVREGGATIDTNVVALGIAVPLVHAGAADIDGGLTVKGGGSLLLSGSSTYTGATAVQAGTTLTLNYGKSLATTGMSVTAGSTFAVKHAASLTGAMGAASFDGGSNLSVDLTDRVPATPIFNVTKAGSGAVTLAGTVNLYLPAEGREFSTTPYTLCQYTSITGGPGNLAVTVDPTVRSMTATPTTVGNSIQLAVAYDQKSLVWNPTGTGEWSGYWKLSDDFSNWRDPAAQQFFNLDDVSFTDAGLGYSMVTLFSDVHPRDMLVSNSTGNYSFTDTASMPGGIASKITGIGTTITKSGAGTLTISNTGVNDFTGNVNVNEGTLQVGGGGESANLGTNNTIYLNGTSKLAGTRVHIAQGVSNNLVMSGSAKVDTTGEFSIGQGGGQGDLTMTGTDSINAGAWGSIGRDAGSKSAATMGTPGGSDTASFTCATWFNIGCWGGAQGSLKMYAHTTLTTCTTTSDWATIGQDGTGYLELNDYASFTANDAIDVGESGAAGKGTIVMNGHSSMKSINSGLWIGNAGGSSGEVTMNDFSTIDLPKNEVEVPWNGNGKLHVGDGNSTHNAVLTCTNVLIGWNSDSTSGLVDLNAGGTINTTRIYTGSDNGTHPALSVFNFNGGTLKSTASDTTADPFINNNGGTVDYQLNVKEGGAIIDIPTGMSDTIAPALLHAGTGTDGGLKKNGSGALTLAATPTYNGDTTVNAGVLNANGGISTPSATVYVATGATLNATSIVADTLTIGGAPHLAATAVPEPGTFVLLVLAGLGAFLAWRRK